MAFLNISLKLKGLWKEGEKSRSVNNVIILQMTTIFFTGRRTEYAVRVFKLTL